MSTRLRYLLAAGTALLAVAAVATVSYAAVVTNGVIHGCYSSAADKNGDHALFVTDRQCPSGTVTLIWNQQGSPGPQGTQGPAGPPGAPGVSGYAMVSQAFPIGCGVCSSAQGFFDVTVACPAGTRILGGGYDVGMVGVEVKTTAPVQSPDGWRVAGYNSAHETTGSVYAVCATVSS